MWGVTLHYPKQDRVSIQFRGPPKDGTDRKSESLYELQMSLEDALKLHGFLEQMRRDLPVEE